MIELLEKSENYQAANELKRRRLCIDTFKIDLDIIDPKTGNKIETIY